MRIPFLVQQFLAWIAVIGLSLLIIGFDKEYWFDDSALRINLTCLLGYNLAVGAVAVYAGLLNIVSLIGFYKAGKPRGYDLMDAI